MAEKHDTPDWVQAPDGSWQQRDHASEAAAKKKREDAAKAKGTGYCLLAGIVIIAIGWFYTSRQPDPTPEQQSSLACTHFRNIVGDVRSGKLTSVELRVKLKEVDDNASIATARVQNASAAMLRSSTFNKGKDFTDAVGAMDTACTAAGW